MSTDAKAAREWWINSAGIALPKFDGETSSDCSHAIEYSEVLKLREQLDLALHEIKHAVKFMRSCEYNIANEADPERQMYDSLRNLISQIESLDGKGGT